MTTFNGRQLAVEEEAHSPVFALDGSGHFCGACGLEALDSIHDSANFQPDDGFHAAKAHARRIECYCGRYENHLCPYHEGFMDGYHEAADLKETYAYS